MRSLLLIALAAAPAFAQPNSATAAARLLWESNGAFISASAVDMPESLYAYRPAPEVRTFGELIGHVAGSQNMFCAMVLGDKQPAEDAIEKTAKTKAELIDALKKSTDYCDKAYATTDAGNAEMVDLFGQQRSKLYTLLMNASHNSEHYGNIVTYMRMNKMVPPSSRPSR
jgi:uncharacterized damage-inducible protein DinB